MSTVSLPGGVTREDHDEGKCYAQVKPMGIGLPARRCHRNARALYRFQEHESPLCGQHSRKVEDLLRGKSIDFAITTVVRWSRGR